MEEKYGYPTYGMVEYEDQERRNVKRYWVLYNEKIKGLEQVIIPQSKWIEIKIHSQEAKDIQEVSQIFYKDFLPSCRYNFKDLPELEFYHDGITDFLIPIEKD
jgi:predicted transcriptional regulator YdeE